MGICESVVNLVNALNCLVSSRVFTGAHHLTSPPSQSDSLLAMFDPLSSGEGNLRSQNALQPIRARNEKSLNPYPNAAGSQNSLSSVKLTKRMPAPPRTSLTPITEHIISASEMSFQLAHLVSQITVSSLCSCAFCLWRGWRLCERGMVVAVCLWQGEGMTG